MINAVNNLPYVPNVGMAKDAQPQQISGYVNNTVDNPNLNGMNALGAYNSPVVKKSAPKTITPLLPTILQPEAIHSLDGAKIYNSMGELDSIVKKDEKYTTVYKMAIQAPQDAVRKIQTFDNQTGKLIKSQENLNIIESGKMPQIKMIEVKDFNADGKVKSRSVFYDGKPEMFCEYEYGQNGYEKRNIVVGGLPRVEEEFTLQNISKYTIFDDKGQLSSVETINRSENSSQTVFYKNGIPVRVQNEAETPIPNLTGKNPQADKDLLPALPYVLGYDPKQVQGNKSYYSNGVINAIETITANGGRMIHHFESNGNLSSIEDATNKDAIKRIFFYDNYYVIEENIGKNIQKTTTFNDDGSKEVGVINMADKTEKYANYSKEGILMSYGDFDNDGNRMLMLFNRNGDLIKVI